MSVPIFQPQTHSPFRKAPLYILAVVGVGLLVYFGGDLFSKIGNIRGKSALNVTVFEGDAQILVNNEPLGNTPFESEEIRPGDNKITVKGDSNTYEVSLNFLANSQVVINRDLGVSDVFSSGQNFWIEKSDSGSVLSIITEPSGAMVFIDNTQVGETPYSSSTLTEGEYDLRLELGGYESQSARIKIQKNHKLSISARLFPFPVSPKVVLLEGSESLYGVFSENSLVTSNPTTWVSAVMYWNSTRGINIADAGVNKDLVFDYYLDYEGNLYDVRGELISGEVLAGNLADDSKGVYLGRLADGEGLTEAAAEAFEGMSGSVVVSGKSAKILETGVGWLRVRDTGSLDGKEVTRVDVGDEFSVLEESTGWVKIKVDEETEGWVSSTYVEVTE